MGFFKAIKEIVSPVPSFGNKGPIKFRSMSFGTTDSLKAYLDATIGQEENGKIIVTYDDANQIIDYFYNLFVFIALLNARFFHRLLRPCGRNQNTPPPAARRACQETHN